MHPAFREGFEKTAFRGVGRAVGGIMGIPGAFAGKVRGAVRKGQVSAMRARMEKDPGFRKKMQTQQKFRRQKMRSELDDFIAKAKAQKAKAGGGGGTDGKGVLFPGATPGSAKDIANRGQAAAVGFAKKHPVVTGVGAGVVGAEAARRAYGDDDGVKKRDGVIIIK